MQIAEIIWQKHLVQISWKRDHWEEAIWLRSSTWDHWEDLNWLMNYRSNYKNIEM